MKCAVQSVDGDCPNTPIQKLEFENGNVWLCDKCTRNARNGAYGEKFQSAAQVVFDKIKKAKESNQCT